MTISLSNAGKRFNYDWIFRRLDYTFTTGNSYAIVGPNGSGKSTLLQTLAGYSWLSEGTLTAKDMNGNAIADDTLYEQVTIAAPYLEVVDEMTLMEFWQFQEKFHPLLPGVTPALICERLGLGLASAQQKQIRYFSSGMKQRVKLGQAFFSSKPVLLLDEPCTNLDADGIELYHTLLSELSNGKLVVICSNDHNEIRSCTQRIDIRDYK
ncbi:MAG: ATP-binding cassette domain-containing protein [Bacteroidota bacterium]